MSRVWIVQGILHSVSVVQRVIFVKQVHNYLSVLRYPTCPHANPLPADEHPP